MHRMLWADDLREDKGYFYCINLLFPSVDLLLLIVTVIAIPALLREGSLLGLILLLLLTSLYTFFTIRYLSWINRRYSVDETGITVCGFFRQRTYPWAAVREAGLFTISLLPPKHQAAHRPFLLLFLGKTSLKNIPLSLDLCWLFGSDVLFLRLEGQRRQECENYLSQPVHIYDWNSHRARYELREEDRDTPPCPAPFSRRKWEAACEKR